MKYRLSIMRKIDLLVLNLIEQFKITPTHQRFIDEYNVLEEWQQFAVKIALMLLCFLLPIIFILILFSFYSSSQADLELYQRIIDNSNRIIQQSRELDTASKSFYGEEITNKNILSNKLNNILNTTGIDNANINISEFDMIESSGVNQITADIQFKNLTDENLFSFLRRFVFNERFKIRSIEIEKDKSSSLLYGKFGVSYFSKTTLEEVE